ncbi:MAG: serine/threonine protein kinase [Pyrinomonadaceae bacterium]
MEEKTTITPELREQAEKLFRAAALLKSADWEIFLTMNCADDRLLRSEVETLLRYLPKETDARREKMALETDGLTLSRTKANGRMMPKGFMEQPVLEIVAEHMALSHRADNETLPDELLDNRYRLVKVIKKGGMGIVYEAHDLRQKHSARNGDDYASVAVKKMLLNSFENESLRRMFENEASLQAKLKHPALPKFQAYFTERDYQYLIMEFVPGKDLAEQLKENGRGFPIEQVLQWADELLDVLEYLHNQSPPVFHRDIKPANLKLSEQNKIVLLDFGIAKEVTGQTNYTYTRNGTTCTPDYASPEQLEGRKPTQSDDIFSLAMTLFHLATGVPPNPAAMRLEYVKLRYPDPLQLASEVNKKDVPLKIAEVLHRAMSLQIEDRWSAAEMREALLKARLHVSLNDMLTSVLTNVTEIYAAVLKALKTQLSIVGSSIATKYKRVKGRVTATTVASYKRLKGWLATVTPMSFLDSKTFEVFFNIIIGKFVPVILFICLISWLQNGAKLPTFITEGLAKRRFVPSNAGQYVLSPPSSGFSNKPTRGNAESYGVRQNAKEFWTTERFFSFGDSYDEYYKKEEELQILNFTPKNYKAIKQLAREQIKLLKKLAEENRQAAEANEQTLPAANARDNIKRVEILRQRAELLLKLDAGSARMIKRKREQLKSRADQFELKYPRIYSGNPADRSPSYKSNVVAETGL